VASSILDVRPGLTIAMYMREASSYKPPKIREIFADGFRTRRMTQTRRLAAILAADVAGYSRLIGVDEGGSIFNGNRQEDIWLDK